MPGPHDRIPDEVGDDWVHCEECNMYFPADEPMIECADLGEFCSYDCLVQFITQGGVHPSCMDHAGYAGAVRGFAERMARMAERQLGEKL